MQGSDDETRPHPRAPRFLLRHKVLFGVLGAAGVLLLGMTVGFAVMLSGALSTAATTQHSALTHWILDSGLKFSVRSAAREIAVPPLADESMVSRGLSCYRQHCLQCHGAPGIAPSPEALGMMPVPSNLAQTARDWSPAWLYHVTRKGIRMTGMPAWEFRLSDANLWATVAFLRTLPSLDAARFRALISAAPLSACGAADHELERESPDVILLLYACHSCHRIEGVVGPKIDVGPALVDLRKRKYIAGVLPNTRDNLVRWIVDPHAVVPDSLMPDLNVAMADAEAMADYLLGAQQ